MFERHLNPRKQGDIGLGVAIGWFTANGYTVSVPLTDSQPYDLVVEQDGVLSRVSVKTTTLRKNGGYEVGLRTQGGNKTQTNVRHFDSSGVELLFVACSNGTNYLIPSAAISAKSAIVVGEKWSAYQLAGMV